MILKLRHLPYHILIYSIELAKFKFQWKKGFAYASLTFSQTETQNIFFSIIFFLFVKKKICDQFMIIKEELK